MSGTEDTDLVTVGEVRERLNIVERLTSAASGQDEFLAAILRNQQVQLLQELGRAGLPGGPGGEGIYDDAETGALPQSIIGVAAEDIDINAKGSAVFQLEGSVFEAEVRNSSDQPLDAGGAVEVVGRKNAVDAAGAAGGVSGLFSNEDPDTFQYRGRLRAVPRVLESDDTVKVANQRYINGEYESVDATLEAGEEKTVAEINVQRNEFILFKYTNATAHETVKYNYYIDGANDPDPALSGTQPWATPPDLYEVVPDGYQLVDESVRLALSETSGNTEYDTIQGTLTGFVLSV